jgi:hypothetical protein
MATDGLIGINSISFEISYKAQIPVHKHSSREHIIMHFLKRLWQWYTDRRIERRMLKGPGVYRTQTSQSHIPGRKMPTLPISTSHSAPFSALLKPF